MDNKKPNSFKITVVGPCFVGKTSIINRFINNSFSNYYMPTSDVSSFYYTLNMNDDNDADGYYVNLEIVDTFPLNHPLLVNDKLSEDEELERELKQISKLTTQEMEEELREIINNRMFLNEEKKKKVPNPHFSHALVFVFDCSEVETFNVVVDYIEGFNKVEESNKIKIKIRENKQKDYSVKKIIVGNKADMKTIDYQKLIMKRHSLFRDIEYIETSAITNTGIYQIFKSLVTKILDDPYYEDPDYIQTKKPKFKNFSKLLGMDEKTKKPQMQSPFLRIFGCGGTFCFGSNPVDLEDSDESEEEQSTPKKTPNPYSSDEEDY